MEENVLFISVQLNNLSLMYDHRDWESLLYTNENDISKPVSDISLKDRLPSFEVRLDTELYDSSLNIKLPDVQEASCGVAHMKFSLNSSTGMSRSHLLVYAKILIFLSQFYALFSYRQRTKIVAHIYLLLQSQ